MSPHGKPSSRSFGLVAAFIFVHELALESFAFEELTAFELKQSGWLDIHKAQNIQTILAQMPLLTELKLRLEG